MWVTNYINQSHRHSKDGSSCISRYQPKPLICQDFFPPGLTFFGPRIHSCEIWGSEPLMCSDFWTCVRDMTRPGTVATDISRSSKLVGALIGKAMGERERQRKGERERGRERERERGEKKGDGKGGERMGEKKERGKRKKRSHVREGRGRNEVMWEREEEDTQAMSPCALALGKLLGVTWSLLVVWHDHC